MSEFVKTIGEINRPSTASNPSEEKLTTEGSNHKEGGDSLAGVNIQINDTDRNEPSAP